MEGHPRWIHAKKTTSYFVHLISFEIFRAITHVAEIFISFLAYFIKERFFYFGRNVDIHIERENENKYEKGNGNIRNKSTYQ
jgi:hypothetical protein